MTPMQRSTSHRRWLSVIILILAGLFADNTIARQTLEFPPDVDKIELPLARAGKLLCVAVTINGQDAGLFLLDTGANAIAIDATFAQQLQLNPLRQITIQGTAGDVSSGVCAVDSFAIGNATLRNTYVGTVDLSHLRREMGTDRLNGIVGTPFLEQLPFTIDWSAAVLTLYPPGDALPDSSGDQSIVMLNRMPAVEVRLENDLSGMFVVDTGSNQSIALSPALATAYTHWLRGRPWVLRQVSGVGGGAKMRIVKLSSVEVLGQRLADVDLSYDTRMENASARQGAGAIGAGLLQNAKVTFDYRRQYASAAFTTGSLLEEWNRPDFSPTAVDLLKTTSVMRAAMLGNVEYIGRFLDQGVDVNAADTTGYTALHHAIDHGQEAAALHLLQAGARIDATTIYNETPLLLAAREGNPVIVERLLELNAALESPDINDRTPLIAAAERGRSAVVARLVKAGADIHFASRASGTATNAAAMHGHAEVVKILLDAGADVNQVDPYKKIPLIITAVMGGSRQVVDELLARHPNINATNAAGQTALFAAASEASSETIAMLLEAGADKTSRDKDGNTAFDIAIQRGDPACMSLLDAR